MKRLDTKSLLSFLQASDIAVVFFGGADKTANMAQAEEFAFAWADCVTGGIAGVAFGYADHSVDGWSRGQFNSGGKPAVLIACGGRPVRCFMGPCSRTRIVRSIDQLAHERCGSSASAPGDYREAA